MPTDLPSRPPPTGPVESDHDLVERSLQGDRDAFGQLAERYYRSADRGLPALPWRAAFAIRSARDIYASIGDEIARREHDVTSGRAVVSRHRKLTCIALAALRITASTPRRAARILAGRRHTTPTRVLELGDVPRL